MYKDVYNNLDRNGEMNKWTDRQTVGRGRKGEVGRKRRTQEE